MRVTMILPALTEATSPLFRPIKYSLFPPLGLATLAAYLGPDDEAEIQDEHVEPRRPTARTASPITTVLAVRTWCLAVCTSRRCPAKRPRTRTRSFLVPARTR